MIPAIADLTDQIVVTLLKFVLGMVVRTAWLVIPLALIMVMIVVAVNDIHWSVAELYL